MKIKTTLIKLLVAVLILPLTQQISTNNPKLQKEKITSLVQEMISEEYPSDLSISIQQEQITNIPHLQNLAQIKSSTPETESIKDTHIIPKKKSLDQIRKKEEAVTQDKNFEDYS